MAGFYGGTHCICSCHDKKAPEESLRPCEIDFERKWCREHICSSLRCELNRLQALEKTWASRSKDLHGTIERLEGENLRLKEIVEEMAGRDCVKAAYKHPPCGFCLPCHARSALAPKGGKS